MSKKERIEDLEKIYILAKNLLEHKTFNLYLRYS